MWVGVVGPGPCLDPKYSFPPPVSRQASALPARSVATSAGPRGGVPVPTEPVVADRVKGCGKGAAGSRSSSGGSGAAQAKAARGEAAEQQTAAAAAGVVWCGMVW